jgi:hypothetical protein
MRGHELDRKSTAPMPTNLPDPRKRKMQEIRDKLLNVIFVVLKAAMTVSGAMIIWKVWYAG